MMGPSQGKPSKGADIVSFAGFAILISFLVKLYCVELTPDKQGNGPRPVLHNFSQMGGLTVGDAPVVVDVNTSEVKL